MNLAIDQYKTTISMLNTVKAQLWDMEGSEVGEGDVGGIEEAADIDDKEEEEEEEKVGNNDDEDEEKEDGSKDEEDSNEELYFNQEV